MHPSYCRSPDEVEMGLRPKYAAMKPIPAKEDYGMNLTCKQQKGDLKYQAYRERMQGEPVRFFSRVAMLQDAGAEQGRFFC